MSTQDFIDSVVDKDFNAAENSFEQMMGQRIDDALAQQKVVAAGHIFGELPDDVEDVDPEDLELDDDETEEESDDDDDDDEDDDEDDDDDED